MADDRDRPLGMVEVDYDLEVAGRRGRRLVDDRDLFLLGATLERVAQTEEPGGDDCSAGRTSKPVDRSAARVVVSLSRFALFAVDRFGLGAFGFVVDGFSLVPIVLHAPTVCRISPRRTPGCGPSLPVDHGGEP
jgi:hypothetical protein